MKHYHELFSVAIGIRPSALNINYELSAYVR